MNRNRFPSWVNATIDWIADHPMSLVGRIAATRIGRPPRGVVVPATSFDDRPVRVLIAPVNYSGQGFAWARALEAADHSISARNMSIDVPGGFAFPTDLNVPVATFHNDADWQRRELVAAQGATHVLIEAEEPPFGRLYGRSLAHQVDALERDGVDVAFLAHGTDVRLPSRHVARSQWSHYALPEVYTPRAETVAARNIDFLRGVDGPVFVSTPDLLVDVPWATWVPVVIDPVRWQVPRGERDAGRPLRVAHAPSVQVVKGTELILPVLRALEAEGVITLTLIEGVASAAMPDAFAQADVVLDQFRIGSYGVAACEAMASGCVVVGHVDADVRAVVEAECGMALPIVEADPAALAAVLRQLQTDPGFSSLQREGLAFVREVHDGRRSAEVLHSQWISADRREGR